jgi:hypothetical protein
MQDGAGKETMTMRFTPEEKALLEQKVRVAAAMGQTPLSLADALRMGAMAMLDDMIAGFKEKRGTDGQGDGYPTA